MKRLLIRLLCAALCVTLLFGTFSVSLMAQEEQEMQEVQEIAAPILDEPLLAEDEEPVNQGYGNVFFEWFFKIFGFLGYHYEPSMGFVYNTKPAWQWLAGFNALYDAFSWTAHVQADTLKFYLNYGGKDWMIQAWKGGYALCLSTGGEIGVYTKSPDSKVNHYSGAVLDDWLNMSITIYNKNAKLLTRPFEKYWWCTGYGLSVCTDFLNHPRKNVVMDATIELKDAAMAEQFIAQLTEKSFTQLEEGQNLGLSTPDTFEVLDEKTVRFFWQSASDGWN